MDDAERAAYAAIIAGHRAPVHAVWLGPNRGRGLVAAQDLAPGTLLWAEPPLAAMQGLASRRRAVACAHCLRPLPTLAPGETEHEGEEEEEEGEGGKMKACAAASAAAPAAEYVRCWAGCQLPFCVRGGCMAAAWSTWHCVLCTARLANDDHPLVRFIEHAIETNPAHLLAAQIYARVLAPIWLERPSAEAVQLLVKWTRPRSAPAHHVPAWRPDMASDEAPDEATMRTQIQSINGEAFLLLRAALYEDSTRRARNADDRACIERLFGADGAFFADLMGAIALNQIALRIRTDPAQRPMRDAARSPDDGSGTMEVDDGGPGRAEDTASGSSDIDADSGSGSDSDSDSDPDPEPTPGLVHGVGIYELASLMNHSCTPNAYTCQMDGTATLYVCASEPIRHGEEICVSYVDVNDRVAVRQRELLDYRFICDCARCKREQGSA